MAGPGEPVRVHEANSDFAEAQWFIEEAQQLHREGTPEQVARVPGSATGEYLARVLRGEPLVPLSAVTFAESAGRVPISARPAPIEIVPLPEKRAAAAGTRHSAE